MDLIEQEIKQFFGIISKLDGRITFDKLLQFANAYIPILVNNSQLEKSIEGNFEHCENAQSPIVVSFDPFGNVIDDNVFVLPLKAYSVQTSFSEAP